MAKPIHLPPGHFSAPNPAVAAHSNLGASAAQDSSEDQFEAGDDLVIACHADGTLRLSDSNFFDQEIEGDYQAGQSSNSTFRAKAPGSVDLHFSYAQNGTTAQHTKTVTIR